MKLFFAAGLDDCSSPSEINGVAGFFGLPPYPADRFPAGLKDFVENIMGRDRVGSYVMEGDLHQHIFRPRFYEENGVGVSVADWLGEVLAGNPSHVGNL